MRVDDLHVVPADLPVPEDDGAARHLPGMPVPPSLLPSTNGDFVNLGEVTRGLVVVYCYPRMGRPDMEALGGTAEWNAIPGARGCTPQSCGYRDRYRELTSLGAFVYGLSTQSTEYQKEAVDRLALPFPLLSDPRGEYSSKLRLPRFEVQGIALLKRLTLIIEKGRIIHCFYPVFPPDGDASNVVDWIRASSASRLAGHE